jgi:predicted DNA-binding protein YlxM (UPF0122 family)
MRGYSQDIVDANKQADALNLGVLLGRLCILKKYPVTEVAKDLGISRQSVYDYFLGRCKPAKERGIKIAELIQKLSD